MKKLTILFLSLFVLGWFGMRALEAKNYANTPDELGIQFFEGSYAEALAKAKAENKHLFVDIYASWCGPCKRLKATTFRDPELGAYFKEHFIAIAVDGEKGEGPGLVQKFGLRAYPSLYWVQADGSLAKQHIGFISASQLLNLSKTLTIQK
ncbi:MAG: thioredoxin family protein [Sphingobacteriaceae bacterium]|nr:thioredoxin family protein [Sphingobacteriaceae bacterium]